MNTDFLASLAPALALASLLLGCGSERVATPTPTHTPAVAPPSDVMTPERAISEHGKTSFGSYWYMGLAELDRYQLRQSRYGELHDGEAVLVFVTEDFLTDRQVKYEHGDKTNAVPILKVNAYRRFNTGVYPYSLLTSTFSPVATVHEPIKVSASVQEWCGHAYFQLNRTDVGYRAEAHSYFQSEADRTTEIPDAQLEDSLWARVRRDPSSLPTGDIELVPAIHFLRLMHQPLEVVAATATLETTEESPHKKGRQLVYRLQYEGGRRTLVLYVEEAFPHRILAWEETGPSIFSKEPLTTTAVLTSSIMLDYWNKHGVADAGYRQTLGLMY